MTAVKIVELTDSTALYVERQPGGPPLPCVLSLDLRSGELTARTHGEGTPTPEVNRPAGVDRRLLIWWDIRTLAAHAANDLLREAEPLAQRILDGARIADGPDGHSVGELDAAAEEAVGAVAELCEAYAAADSVSRLDPADWFGDAHGDDITVPARELSITADTTDEEIADRLEEMEDLIVSAADGTAVVVNLERYVLQLRDALRDAERRRLAEAVERRSAATAERDALIRRLAGWGDSDRFIADLGGLSHTQVRRIRTSRPARAARA